jgi:2-oxoisovalerate dehydrogenase E1 component alpha subunit
MVISSLPAADFDLSVSTLGETEVNLLVRRSSWELKGSRPAGEVVQVVATTTETSLIPDFEPIRLIDTDGSFHPRADLPLDLDERQLLELHRHLRMMRRLDQEFIALQRQGQLAVYPSSLGQEAAQVGTTYALEQRDWIAISYREHGCAYVRGVDPVDLGHVWRGTWQGWHDTVRHRITPHCVPIATSALHAVGIAMGERLDGTDTVAASYFGDGGTSAGDAHEALNFAGVFKAPVVFVVQNNQWAISVPLERQTAAPSIAHKAIGYGMPGVRVDGNDVLACFAVMRHAVQRARRGDGPTLLEAVTYRLEAHTTADDAGRYRSDAEVAAWRERDPLVRYERFLRRSGRWDDAFDAETAALVDAAAGRLRDGIFGASPLDPMELFEHVWAEPPATLAGQRQQLAAEIELRQTAGTGSR